MKTIILLVTLGLAVTATAEPIVYPSKGQSDAQTDKDKYECHEWATKETGVDPVALAEQQGGGGTQGKGAEGGAASGAAMGAMRGAASGEGAGAGAAHGAGIGRLIAMVRARKQLKEQQDAGAESASQTKGQLEQYDRAYGTCLTGRGYTVSQ
ncbi:MAG TPA: hypothetical protein VGR62_06755 [Candidatus Binatia bacterium]|jgi:hypothetical protein|nr:hypothetical protein [Candidatus Binatia bacterium]